jgi:hypothetical protein
MSDAIKQAIEALRECLSTLSDFGLESSDAYQQALAALQAMQGEAEPVAWMMVNTEYASLGKSLHWTPQPWHITWQPVPLYTAPQPVVPDGYVPVPIELTETMLRAWFSATRDLTEGVGILDYFRPAYQALLSAGKGETE